ncbi:hypothetical protein AAVH_28713, partial [Aphelenchoides avenae]
IEWLREAEVTPKAARKALIDRFKKDMGWTSLSSVEFCVPADKKPKKRPLKEHRVGPNGEPIRIDDTLTANAANTERVMGTRTGFRDDGKRQWLVKLRRRTEG